MSEFIAGTAYLVLTETTDTLAGSTTPVRVRRFTPPATPEEANVRVVGDAGELRTWVAALRSDRYQQGKRWLSAFPEDWPADVAPEGVDLVHCCLGVWCDLLVQRGLLSFVDDETLSSTSGDHQRSRHYRGGSDTDFQEAMLPLTAVRRLFPAETNQGLPEEIANTLGLPTGEDGENGENGTVLVALVPGNGPNKYLRLISADEANDEFGWDFARIGREIEAFYHLADK